jgi:hypothetical protein
MRDSERRTAPSIARSKTLNTQAWTAKTCVPCRASLAHHAISDYAVGKRRIVAGLSDKRLETLKGHIVSQSTWKVGCASSYLTGRVSRYTLQSVPGSTECPAAFLGMETPKNNVTAFLITILAALHMCQPSA